MEEKNSKSSALQKSLKRPFKMIHKKTFAEQSEQYFAGELSELEKMNLREKVTKDPKLEEIFAITEAMYLALGKDPEKREAEVQLYLVYNKVEQEGFHAQFYQENNRSKFGKYVLAIAASLLLLILSYNYFFENGKRSYQLTFEQYYEPESENIDHILDRLSEIGFVPSGDEGKELLIQGLENYREGDFQEALKALELYHADAPADLEGQFYLGISYLAQGAFRKTVYILEPLVENELFEQQELLHWYLALAYLKGGKRYKHKVKQHLEKLTESRKYRQQTLQILELIQ